MKWQVKTVFFGFVFSINAFASHKIGNGGGVMVCPAATEDHFSWRSVTLLDLWEAETLNQSPLFRDDRPVISQIRDAFLRLPQTPFYVRARDKANLLLDRVGVVDVASNITILPPEDAKSNVVQRDCLIKGVAFYNDVEETLYLDSMLFGEMFDTDQAALFMHEAIYRELRRTYGDDDSIRARHIVGCGFRRTACTNLDPL